MWGDVAEVSESRFEPLGPGLANLSAPDLHGIYFTTTRDFR